MSFEPKIATLADFCEDVSYGYTESASWDLIGPKFLRITDIQGGTLDWDTVPFCPASDQNTKKYSLKIGDIVVARTGNSTGENAQIVSNPPSAVFASYLIRFRPDSNRINPFYLGYQLRSEVFKQYVLSVRSGSAQPGANAKQLGAFPVQAIEREKQDEAVTLLRALDDRIALLRETNTTLEAIAQALFKSWFVDFDPVLYNRSANAGTQAPSLPAEIQALFPSRLVDSPQGLIPEGWDIFRLGDITARITKGTTPTTLKKAFTETGINFVKVESLTEHGEFLTDKFSFIDEETHQLLKRSQLKSGDVLVTIAGTIGRVAEVTEDIIPANTNQAVALIRPIQEKLPSGLIRRFLQRNDSKQHMGERVVQAVQANLSLGSLSDMAVVVPPESVVSKLHELGFENIDTSKNSNMRQIKTLTNLRDTLLPRLISGQLRLPEAEAALAEVV